MKKYKWKASSDDGTFIDDGILIFRNKQNAYEDMRECALLKMKLNTEFAEDFGDGSETIMYEVWFSQDKIIYKLHNVTYTYEIIELKENEY